MGIAQIIQEIAADLANASLDGSVINLQRIFRESLEQKGFSSLKATEIAEGWLERLLQELEEKLFEWDLLGIPRPLLPASCPSTFITFRHRNYEPTLGTPGISAEFPGIYKFVASLSPREFLHATEYTFRRNTLGCQRCKRMVVDFCKHRFCFVPCSRYSLARGARNDSWLKL